MRDNGEDKIFSKSRKRLKDDIYGYPRDNRSHIDGYPIEYEPWNEWEEDPRPQLNEDYDTIPNKVNTGSSDNSSDISSSDNDSNDNNYGVVANDDNDNTLISGNDEIDDVITNNDKTNDTDILQVSSDENEGSELISEEYYVNENGTIYLVKPSEESESLTVSDDKEREQIEEPIEVNGEDLELITDPDVLEDYIHYENLNNEKEQTQEPREVKGEDLVLITDSDELENYIHNENLNNEKEQTQEVREVNGDDLILITDSNELEIYNHYEEINVEAFNEENEQETTHEEYKEYNYDAVEVNGEDLELITDQDELENYNDYEEINIEDFTEDDEQEVAHEEYEEYDYDTEEVNGEDLILITDPDELENYNHYENINIQDFTEDNEYEAAHEEYEEYDYDTEEIDGDDFELITDPDELENYSHYENNNIDLSRDNDQEEYEQLGEPTFDKLNEQIYKEQIQEQISEANQKENENPSEEIYATENDKDTEIKLKEIVEDIINRAQVQHNEISSEDRDIINSEDDTLYSGNKKNSSYQSSISRLSSEPFTFQISAEQTETYYQEDQQEQDNQDGENKKTPDNETDKKKEESKNKDRDTTNKKSNGNSSKAEKKSPENLAELYHKETNGRPFYAGKKTEGFKRWSQQRVQGNTKKEKKTKEVNEKNDTHEIKEEWVDALLNHIHTMLDKEISQDIKEELTYIIKNYDKLRKTSKNLPPNLKQIIEELEQFQATYNVYKDRGYEKSIPLLVSKVVKKLRKHFELFKNKAIFKAFLNKENEKVASYEKITSVNNWRELLKANLYKITMLTLKEKSQIIKLIQKEKLLKVDKERLISLLSKLKNEELIVLFGKSFENYAKNYVLRGSGWYEDPGVKRLVLGNYLFYANPNPTLKFIKNLRNEIARHSDILSKYFPNKFIFPMSWLSSLWGFNKDYVKNFRKKAINNLNKRIPEKNLQKLKSILLERYGYRSYSCYKLIRNYLKHKINTVNFIDYLLKELGKYSGDVRLITDRLLSIILVGTLGYINANVIDRITNQKREDYNPDYMPSLERLQIYVERLEAFLGVRAAKCKEIIKSFRKNNPDLKKHITSLYTIKNPLYFHNMDSLEKFYWFGFLCADGGLYNGRITFTLHAHDYDRVVEFGKAVGFDLNRIRDIWSKPIFITVNGKEQYFPPSPLAMLQFGCKEMYEQLKDELGMITSGQKDKDIPQIIRNLVMKARHEANKQHIDWYNTLPGKKALTWLLGYFDGDGSISRSGDKFYPLIIAGSKIFLRSIKKLFQIRNKVSLNSSGRTWSLYLSPELYKIMMLTFADSMQRKRHPDYRDPNGLYLYP